MTRKTLGMALAALLLPALVVLLISLDQQGQTNENVGDNKGAIQDVATKADSVIRYLRGDQGLAGVPGRGGKIGVPGPIGGGGPRGPAGPSVQGSQGVPGGQGAEGVAGSAGGSGTNGTNGADGGPGPPGTDGPPGAEGPPGPVGPRITSFTFTFLAVDYLCTDPDLNGDYTCAVV